MEKEEKKELVNIDIRFLFTLFTSFIAMWIYLYNYIIDLTTMEPTSFLILTLSILHYTIFVCIIPLTVLFFYKGLSYTRIIKDFENDTKIERIVSNCGNFILKWWLFFFSGSLLFMVFSFITDKEKYLVVLILLAYFIAILLYIPIMGGSSNVRRLTRHILSNKSLLRFAIVILGMFSYLGFLTIVSANVKIVTEKDFYKKNDIVRIEVKRKGYIFLPNITEITLNGIPINEKGNITETFSFHIDDTNYRGHYDYIAVKYTSQIILIKKIKYNPIRITAE